MQDKFIRRPEVLKIVGLSATTIWRLERAGTFPMRRKLSTGAVGWLESEIQAWMTERETVGEKGH
ncbi:MAG: AlpA family phage regulatory protein [Nitrospirae bacterium]|nr:AlpA family phage regulatory protein [Nitrospirota bacterium]